MYSHHKHKHFAGLEKLWIVTMISNPQRFRSRYDLFSRFKRMCEKAGANLLVVEVAFGDRPFEITEEDNPHYVQLRTSTELWHKENAINVGISNLPQDWEYVAWIDADVEFMRHDWADEIVHQLQHYDVIQCFQNAIDLGPSGEVLKKHDGFVWSWMNGSVLPDDKPYDYAAKWHPGFAWAMRREAFDNLGGLFDVGILGSGDRHMACALIGRVLAGSPSELTASYKRHLLEWEERCNVHVRKNIGYMPGTIFHHWHGKKADRRYADRWKILIRHNYDPDRDLKRDWQMLYDFTDRGLRMRNDIRNYFRARNEDSIDNE